LVAGACATHSYEEVGPNRYRIDCSAGHHDWSRCHNAAAALCEDGNYDIVSRVSDEASQNVGVNDWDYRGSEVTRAMTVQCLEG
jgi:hypothetical protein